MQWLMLESPSPQTERGVQPLFRKLRLFSDLAVFLAVMAGYALIRSPDLRSEGPARWAAARFIPVAPDPTGFAPARLVGAWRVEVADPRFGGVSALALDGDTLLALTDSGTLIRLPRPGRRRKALVQDLPAGPGNSRFKVNRDSEALARDPAGRGWWVAFEQWHQLWLYDPAFRRAIARIDLGRDRWRANRGIEAMVAEQDGLWLFPEGGEDWLRLTGNRLLLKPLLNPFGSIGDAVRLPDGRLVEVRRWFTMAGLA
jgi:hypothetical protein